MAEHTSKALVAGGALLCGLCFMLGRHFSGGPQFDASSDPAAGNHVAAEKGGQSARGVFPEPTMERLRELLSAPGDSQRQLELELAILDLNAEQLIELWEHARSTLTLSDDTDFDIAAAILGQLAKLDARMALALVERDGAAWKSQLNREVVGHWALVDRDGALEWIANAGSGVRDRALRAALELLGDEDRQAAVQLFRESVEKGIVGKRAWGAREFFSEWGKEDPPAAAQGALEHVEFTGRMDALSGAIRAWTSRDPQAALAWVGEQSGTLSAEQHESLVTSVFDAWSVTDPSAAASILDDVEETSVYKSAVDRLLTNWAATSIPDAAAWVATLQDDTRRRIAEVKLSGGARAEGKLDEGIAYTLEKLPENDWLGHHLYLLVSNKIDGQNFEANIEWIDSMAPSEKLKEEFYNTLLHQWRRADIAQAVRHLDIMPDPVRRAEDYEFYASVYAESDLDDAREWANALPESVDRDRALVGVGSAWVEENPPEAIGWIQQLEAGELQDRLTAMYLGAEAENDIPAAIALASSIGDPFERDHSLEFVMGKWLSSDPAAATEAINASTALSETAKWRLLQSRQYR